MIDSLDILLNEDYIEHYGILGMKWGIRRTPEQLGHRVSKNEDRFDKYTEKAAKAGEKGNVKKLTKYTNKAEKVQKKNVKLNKKLEKALKRQNEHDEKVIRKGSIDDIIKIADRLSEDQMKRATNRIRNINTLNELRPDATKAIDKLVNVGGKVAAGAQHVYNIADNVNKFRGVMKDIQMSEIKEIERLEEKERKDKVTKATRSGDLDQMKKVWGQATLEELKDMSDTRKLRYEIENIDFSKLDNEINKASQWEARKRSKTNDDE